MKQLKLKNQQVVFLAPKKNIKERLRCNENKQIMKGNQRKMQSATASIISIKESTNSSAAAKKKACATMH